MRGIGRECGNDSDSPRCNRRSSTPTSSRANIENGGDLTSPLSQASGLSPRPRKESRGATGVCQFGHKRRGEYDATGGISGRRENGRGCAGGGGTVTPTGGPTYAARVTQRAKTGAAGFEPAISRLTVSRQSTYKLTICRTFLVESGVGARVSG